ncbi:HAMP domain-containing protein [Hungatella effluvii]|uniref:HAMP domain-containing protein n=1 Tax=Hungatella effluvii TaxID=1096246 RepID=A0A2V3Y1K5_9FIRM|nr:histidine kinase [Hungatella effluvii]PXX51997.1 HAMP domain-containing protein [Hungatella effluvii]
MKVKKIISSNHLIILLISCYLLILTVISTVACYFSYQRSKVELLTELDMMQLQAAEEYKNLTDQFWEYYMPIFENSSQYYPVLQSYFVSGSTGTLSPLDKFNLSSLLSQIALRDNRVQWVAAWSPSRSVNYIYDTEQRTLQMLDDDFPYLEHLQKKSKAMEIYSEQQYDSQGVSWSTLAIAGGLPAGMGKGSIIIGCSLAKLDQICQNNSPAETLQFDILVDGNRIFSSGDRPVTDQDVPLPGQNGLRRLEGRRYYLSSYVQPSNGAVITYSLRFSELLKLSHKNTPFVLVIILVLVLLSVLLYVLLIRTISHEVGMIRDGLDKIGQKQFDSRITGPFFQNSFANIAESINEMAQSLKENIDRAYFYELKQKEAELQELQSKFNPHFLYNSLELFRARCYQNDDPETAELIAQTASIFRGFIGSRTFIPIQEELAFSKRYLVLFSARFDDGAQILYDIDTEVLQYGIIRNVFQPLIENYFSHGYDAERDDNSILFRGYIQDEEHIVFEVTDNGLGISPDRLSQLNASLHEPITSEKESYGLKNLHQRLRLFYGEGYGLSIYNNPVKGITIKMVIRKLKCSEGEN